MNNSKSKEIAIENLRILLKNGPADAASIGEKLKISQPTFSRLWKDAGHDITSFGAARSTQYAMTRSIADLGTTLPLFVVDQTGQASPFGELRMLQNNWYVFTPANGLAYEVTEGLPFFLQDLRPQGFLGRMVPRMHPDLLLPEKIQDWSDDNALVYLARRGENLPGNLIVGNESYRRFLTLRGAGDMDAQSESSRTLIYPDLALRANQGEIIGSSAGGEQPKFTTAVMREDGEIEHVIVKFSPQRDMANGRRWADLLIAEHLAMETLRGYDLPACQSAVVMTDERVYLEVVRFDRCGVRGRTPVVSMAGVDCLLGALDKNWTQSTQLLVDARRLSTKDHEIVRLLDVFGALIGNSDRHPGNLSLSWQADGKFALAPVYDMLPMMYRPNTQGEIVERTFELAVLDKLDLSTLAKAQTMAGDFWHLVNQDARISKDFKAIAQQHAEVIDRGLPVSTYRQEPSNNTPHR
ncbi:type II toxin-antitoxin system HipA family toxin YjjJ [Herbaspirillum sp. RTI4]|uniref:type II toxin-antitoxin system HipA family toxin YjjJ n=1 Tax=Herbaspirillum sp. RTI4 TaxID=3048640 RepID=UPI002AB53A86|nr:type II toxin-antitoxin system HipA family toxin YjjJ [Herbaspirillum sp. RTI4]MDY7576746.1 type II toxin-antitoxin system HipA family toxin YjjJ [Herbaspirillum sp. RTI4]MEA9983411.1 type II toxin-antitoxin system HipA family toxin YjjJ [Herbaspirillum sp. RTI4]